MHTNLKQIGPRVIEIWRDNGMLICVKISKSENWKSAIISRNFAQFKNLVFVAHLHVIRKPYIKFQSNRSRGYGVMAWQWNDKISKSNNWKSAIIARNFAQFKNFVFVAHLHVIRKLGIPIWSKSVQGLLRYDVTKECNMCYNV